ncbi:MAG: ABC-2 family transporter protein [Planctomycetes bacterium]|nr:ABC-2 family transporter protein [Planctomycetota bacterium]
MRALKIYAALFAQMLKVRLAYRGDFLADLFATALGGLSSLFFVLLFFVPVDSLAGWKRDEVLLIAGLSSMSYGLFATVSWNLFEFGDRYIIEGRFDRVLLRPISTFAQILCDQFRIPVLAETVIGAGVVATAMHRLGIGFGALEWLFVAVTVACGALLYVFVFTILASVSFHFEDRVGVAPPVFNVIPFGRWPQEIFPWPIRTLLRWVIPFGFVAYYPSTALLGRGSLKGMAALSPLVTLAFGVLAALCWRLGVRKYESTGS